MWEFWSGDDGLASGAQPAMATSPSPGDAGDASRPGLRIVDGRGGDVAIPIPALTPGTPGADPSWRRP
jgi:hypothetical protein